MQIVRSVAAKIRKWLGIGRKPAEKPASKSFSTGA
jgi:hypothetical protein